MLEKKIREVDEIIKGLLGAESGYAKTIIEAANYSINAGGKRLRPLLMREFFLLYGGGDESVLRHFMAAIEMIHTYSLVHDDLPAIDNDDLRRGKETTHKKYGEAMGILAGDALLNMAYEQIAFAMKSIYACETKSGLSRKEQLQRTVKAFEFLSARAGVGGMIGGQVVDVEYNGDFVDDEMLLYVYRNKTGALIAAAMMVGAVLGGADEFDIHTIERIGCEIGVAFQIRDWDSSKYQVMVGLSVPAGGSASVAASGRTGNDKIEVNSETTMFYNITPDAATGNVYIYNTGSSMVSVTDLKITGTQKYVAPLTFTLGAPIAPESEGGALMVQPMMLMRYVEDFDPEAVIVDPTEDPGTPAEPGEPQDPDTPSDPGTPDQPDDPKPGWNDDAYNPINILRTFFKLLLQNLGSLFGGLGNW